MRCENCSYPVFRYACCCPMCGSAVKTQELQFRRSHSPHTRIGFWLAHLKRTLVPAWRSRPMA
jgi:hypothetical protein